MIVPVVVEGQSLRWYGRIPEIADNSIEFVQLEFRFPEDWDNMVIVAQFTQTKTYNCLLVNNRCFLPMELVAGPCEISVFGYLNEEVTRGTTIPLKLNISRSGFVSSAETPIPPTPDLYAQLIDYFSSIAGSGGGGSGSGTINPEDIAAAVEDYLSKNPPESGEDGGYYIPGVSQPNADSVQFSFTGSKPDMSIVPAVSVALPSTKIRITNVFESSSTGERRSGVKIEGPNIVNDDGTVTFNFATVWDGTDGITPHIGENGNWFLGETDTGVAAGGNVELDTTLTQEGKAADAKAVGDAISKLSGGNVDLTGYLKLPTNEDGTPNNGTAGYYAVSDGNGGVTWVAAGNSGGDTPVVPGSHGIVWDLVNVTSNNNTGSVSDGASLIAVLTAADGYTLGDVTVTMGGEVLTGVWNADTATVTIPSVTGDVVISCAGVEQGEVEYEEIPVALTWDIGKFSGDTGEFTPDSSAPTYGSHTELIDGTKHDIRLRLPYDSAYCAADTEETGGASGKFYMYASADESSYLGRLNPSTGEISTTEYTSLWENLYWNKDIIIPCGYFVRVYMKRGAPPAGGGFLSNPLFKQYITGNMVQVYQVTPSASASVSVAQAVDNDYAMDYGIATTALITDSVADSKSGIDAAYGAVVEEAKNAWLLECNGDMDKIPLIIHTDQHGNYNTALFDFLSEILNWYDVGKVINLGDTVSFWNDSDADHKWNSCTALENYLESMKNVPFSKRIEIFGNHDTWNSSYEYAENQAYLHKYFRNIYARRADNYGNFVVKDDNYNVKYVVVSGFAYDSTMGGHTHYVMHPDSIRWAIAEMEKVDGYDIILLSHCPLNSINYKDMPELWSGRKAKTSGTVTDEYGNSYEFDFTQCDGELLCALHGHNHEDGHTYIGELLDVWLDGVVSANDPIHFVIVDRANQQLNVWKVDKTPQYSNYQIPFVQPETTE